jgi:hypothetical protein
MLKRGLTIILLVFSNIILDYISISIAKAQSTSAVYSDIKSMAASICNNIPLEGKSQSLQITGDIKAELSELMRRLADLGIRGEFKQGSEEYAGVLQKDLGKLVIENPGLFDKSECRFKVFDNS